MRRVDSPRVVYQMQRLVRGGPEVPACITQEFDAHNEPVLIARIRGVVVDINDVWLVRGREVTADEYAYQMARVNWADNHAPHDRRANPERRIRLNDMPPIF